MSGVALPLLLTSVRRTLTVGSAGAFLSAASGLAVVGGNYVVAADDAHHVGVFPCDSDAPGHLVPVMPGELPQEHAERKRRKPDFEAVAALPATDALPHGALLVVGSGSTPRRTTAVLIELDASGDLTRQVRHLDLAVLYDPLREHSPDLNVEGALVLGSELVLLSRANGSSPHNHIARYALADLGPWLAARSDARVAPARITAWRIGEIDGVPLGVTDASAHPGGGWVFSAVAEDTQDSYADGALAGAVVGLVGADGEVTGLARLAPDAKVEGIAARVQAGRTVLTMVTDADDPSRPAELLEATLPG